MIARVLLDAPLSRSMTLQGTAPDVLLTTTGRGETPGRLLDHLRRREQRLLVERPADQLQAERQAGARRARPAR